MNDAGAYRILSLEVRGGFLDGLQVEFDPRLNCIIGGRGTGKTTIIEFLRYALKAPTDPAGELRRDVQKLIASNLKSGHVRVGIETREGIRYTVVRTGSGETSILDSRGKPTSLSLAHGALFDVDVFSAHEIESIATTPAAQLELIDRFLQEPLRDMALAQKKLEADLDANAHDLVALAKRRDALLEELKELPHVEERLRGFQTQARSSAQVEAALAVKALAEREARELELAASRAEERRDLLARLRWDGEAFDDTILGGPHAPTFAEARATVDRAHEVASEHVAAAVAALGRCVARLRELQGELRLAHEEQEVRYRDVLSDHASDRDRAQEQLQLQRRQVALLEARRALEQKQQAIDARLAEREQLIDRLEALRERRSELRAGVTDRLTRDLAPRIKIRVSLERGEQTSRYAELLADGLKGAGRQYGSLVQKIIDIPPRTFARIVQTNAVGDLVDKTGIDREKAIWVVQQLRDTSTIYAVEVVDLQDRPRIELFDGEYKDATSLSTGQRCTAILPILLLDSDKPLLVDQPEDNLDNAFLFTHIVTQIQEVKQRRQLLFVTHNPNIPVSGIAEHVLVMASDGKKAKVLDRGAVDEPRVKQHVATILEGGEEAFERRRLHYGFRGA